MGYERVSAKCTPAWMHFSGSDIALDSKNGFEGTSSQLLYLCTISIAVARGIWLPTKDSCRLRIHEDLTVGVDRDHFAMIGHFFTHTRSFLCIDMSEGIIFINHNLSIYTSEKIERCSWGNTHKEFFPSLFKQMYLLLCSVTFLRNWKWPPRADHDWLHLDFSWKKKQGFFKSMFFRHSLSSWLYVTRLRLK